MRVLAGQEGGPQAPTAVDLAEVSPLRILLAEDSAVNQKVALALLAKLGYRADVVGNGLEALAALERERYDVVLMDVQMPELDGLDTTRRIRERWPAAERPRIVAMTANAMQEDCDACFDAGMDDYVAKPIRPETLAEALRRAHPLASAEAHDQDGPRAVTLPPWPSSSTWRTGRSRSGSTPSRRCSSSPERTPTRPGRTAARRS